MYRVAPDQAPNHLLFQGDIIVVPMVTLRDTAVQVISQDGPLVAICQGCKAEQALPALGQCQQCNRELQPRSRKLRSAPARLRDGETPFDLKSELVVATVETVAALILSHSCDVDTKDRVRFAPVRPLADRRFDRDRERIQNGTGPLSYFHLPATDGLPEAAANLSEAFNLPNTHLGARRGFTSRARGRQETALAPFVEIVDSRRASLNADGLSLIYQATIKLDVRPSGIEFEFTPSAATFEDDPDRPQRDALPRADWTWPLPEWLR